MNEAKFEYHTVTSDSPDGLDASVNEKLAQGWQLQGGVSVSPIVMQSEDNENPDIWFTYAQAVVRPI
jgi:hypothetical protein